MEASDPIEQLRPAHFKLHLRRGNVGSICHHAGQAGLPIIKPSIAVLKPGTPIHWINPTASVHTIRHDDCVGERSCAFDSGPVKPNESYVLPELPEGRYGYHCALHPVMRGVLVVLNADMPAKIEPNNVGSSLPSLD